MTTCAHLSDGLCDYCLESMNEPTNPALNRQYQMGAAAARLYRAGDEERAGVLIRQTVNTDAELRAWAAGWDSVKQLELKLRV